MAFKFAVFCDLLSSLETVARRDPPYLPAERQDRLRRETEGWFRAHRRAIDQLDAASTVALLSCLLPERRTDRVYGLQSATLTRTLCRSLGLSAAKSNDLQAYNRPGNGDLADCLERVLSGGGPPALPVVSVEEVDRTLLALARECQFSAPAIRQPTSSSVVRYTSLGDLFRRSHPREAKWLVRLVLKDFSPVTLDEHLILRSLHFILPDILRFQQDFDAAIDTLKGPFKAYPSWTDPKAQPLLRQLFSTSIKPIAGIKVARSTFCKARSIQHCLNMTGKHRWMVERKYDGEYCEMHIDLDKGKDWLKIFSKSGKDSTEDRKPLRETLRKCLRIGTSYCKIQRRCILLGEMVVYNDHAKQIMPFHKIRKHVPRSGVFLGTDKDSQPHDFEHLMIIFFDVLLLDDQIVMNRKLEDRKGLLNSLYVKKQGRAITAESKVLDFAEMESKRKLMSHLAASVASRQEGLVLKPCGVPYFSLPGADSDRPSSVIKVKKDYIDGLGDEADFAVIGASYKAQEALRGVTKFTGYTHFHLGCLVNKAEVERFRVRPRFKVVGTISKDHCIPPPILDKANDLARTDGEAFIMGTNPTNFDIESSHMVHMDIAQRKPFVFEVLGSSFDKASNTNYWMLRHPRVRKLHEDRTWRDCVSFDELQSMANEALSSPVDSESQENLRWMNKVERSCKRKIARASCQTTPETKTTISPVSVRSDKLQIISPNVMRAVHFTRRAPESIMQAKQSNGSALVKHIRQTENICNLPPTPPTSSPLQTNRTLSTSQGKRPLEVCVSDFNKRICQGIGSSRPQSPHECNTNIVIATVCEDKDKKTSPSTSSAVTCQGLTNGPVIRRQLGDITSRPRQSLPTVSTSKPHKGLREDISSEATPAVSLTPPGPIYNTPAASTTTLRPAPTGPIYNTSSASRAARRPPTRATASLPDRTSNIDEDILNTAPSEGICVISSSAKTGSLQSCPLSTAVIYIYAPGTTDHMCSRRADRQRHLALLHGAMVVDKFAHWDRNSFSHPPLTEEVSESQAYPGLQKVVLVDTTQASAVESAKERTAAAAAKFQAMPEASALKNVPKVKLLEQVARDLTSLNGGCFREKVDIYDCGILTGLCTSDTAEVVEGETLEEELRGWMRRWFVGCVDFDVDVGRSSYKSKEVLERGLDDGVAG